MSIKSCLKWKKRLNFRFFQRSLYFLALVFTAPHAAHAVEKSSLLEMGDYHVCAQSLIGIQCWGSDTSSKNTTQTPDGLSKVDSLKMGLNFACSKKANAFNCWGDDGFGQTQVPTLNGMVDFALGSQHACAIQKIGSNNTVTCWGDDDAPNGKTTPPSMTNPTAIAASYYHSCAIDGNEVKCWGADSNGETANQTLNQPTLLALGYKSSCAVDSDGIHCWGGINHSSANSVIDIAVGFQHACAIKQVNNQNEIVCFGDNSHNQSTPPNLTNPSAVAAGRYHTCAIDEGKVHCWGKTSGWVTTPNDLPISNPTALVAGGEDSCAFQADGNLYCWGRNRFGQLNVPNSDTDTYSDFVDLFPFNGSEWADRDGDGTGDNSDVFPDDNTEAYDSDGDGVGNNKDGFPNDITEWTDTDGDGYGDNKADLYPNDKNEWADADKDGRGDNLADKFPNDKTEWADKDNDKCGDNKDQFDNDPTECLDTDRDGVGDNSDAFPNDENEQKDSDGDGVGDKADARPFDFDNDGVNDTEDAFPKDPSETKDSDGDRVGDNADVFPNNRSEWADNDKDNCGDNRDQFDDDPNECYDFDKDGYGNNSDAFPNDPTEWLDTDNDGCGNNDDVADNDPSICFAANTCDIRELLNTEWGNSPFYERRKTINGERYIKKYYITSDRNIGTTHIPHGTEKLLDVQTWDGSRLESYGYKFACENAKLYWVYRQDSRWKTPFCYDTKDGKTTSCEVEKTEGSTSPIENWWLPSS